MAKITKESFGRLRDGREASLYTLRNTKGTEAKVTTFGARLVGWSVFARGGRRVDVVLGLESAAAYEADTASFGGLVGRVANRIAGGRVTIAGRDYQLECNTGSKKQNHIHGGFFGFHRRLWDAEATDTGLLLTYRSKDGEGGYPGNLTARVRYALSNDNELCLTYAAESDADTLCNLTNHAYFNLAGHDSGSVLAQKIQLFSDAYTWADAESLPDGRILSVAGTPMDLRTLTPIGAHIDDDFDELRMAGGYDHNWVIRDEPAAVEQKPGMFGYDPSCPIDYAAGGLKKAAYAEAEETGLSLTCYTTQPGVQFYTANALKGVHGKDGAVYERRGAFCLETQFYPNAPANPSFPQPYLKQGDTWKAQTVYVLAPTD